MLIASYIVAVVVIYIIFLWNPRRIVWPYVVQFVIVAGVVTLTRIFQEEITTTIIWSSGAIMSFVNIFLAKREGRIHKPSYFILH